MSITLTVYVRVIVGGTRIQSAAVLRCSAYPATPTPSRLKVRYRAMSEASLGFRHETHGDLWRFARFPRHILRIPDEAIVTVVKQYHENGHDVLTVEWSHNKLSIFAVDLEERGELVTDLSIAEGA